MNTTLHLLPAILLAGGALGQPTYQFHTVLRPGMTIDGHVFSAETIGTAVTSDSGEVAFIARWPQGNYYRTAIFTLHRMVASEGEAIEGKVIGLIPSTGRLAINASGVVAYEAFDVISDAPCIFVERQFISSPPPYGPDATVTDFTLNDKDEIVMREPGACTDRHSNLKALSGCGPFSMVSANHRGQIVLAINTAQGPFLMVGTPARH